MADNNRVRWTYVILGIITLFAAGGLVYLGLQPDLQPTLPAPAVPQVAAIAPNFDIVRVDPSGDTVIAGRAAPDATVSVMDGNTLIGTAPADNNGAFVLVPATPLSPGAHQLSLSETLPGGQVVQSKATASINVPSGPGSTALAVISGPGGSKLVSGQGPKAGTLGIGTVDYDADGHAIFSGTAPAGERVSLSLDGVKLGEAIAGPEGQWQLTAKVPAKSGMLTLSDVVNGNTLSTTAPFALETLPAAVASGHVVIARGQNLWLIARHVYGHGNMYTLIYKANAGLIKDPNLIFPGQAFSLPKQ